MQTLAQRVLGISLLRSLAHREFALLWCGQTFSRIGDFLYEIALAWWVLEKTGSPAAMAAVFIFIFAPMLLFLLLGGVVVDRFHRVRLMLASDLARGVIMVVVAASAYSNLLELWHIYMVSLAFGFVDAFFQPAYTALVPDITPPGDLPSANSLTSISVQTGRILGPALAAAIISLGGTPLAFALNASSFFISTAFILPLRTLPSPARRAEEGSAVLREARDGVAIVLGSPWLWVGILVFALTNVTLAGPYSVALPFLVKDHLHMDVGTLGFLYAVFPIGYVLGGVWLGRQSKIHRRGWLMYTGLAVAGLMLLLFGLPVPLAIIVVAALVNGAALEIGGQVWTNMLQELVPNDKLGRVSSIELLGSFVLLPVGFGLTGLATSVLGPAQVFVIGGGITVILATLALIHPAIRNLD